MGRIANYENIERFRQGDVLLVDGPSGTANIDADKIVSNIEGYQEVRTIEDNDLFVLNGIDGNKKISGKFLKEIIRNGLVEETNLSTKLNDYSTVNDTGYSINLNINQTDYIMTIELLNKKGLILSQKQIDFPLESVVVDMDVNKEDKTISLILQNGMKTEPIYIGDIFDTSDLLSQEELERILNEKDYVTRIEYQTKMEEVNTKIQDLKRNINDTEENIGNLWNQFQEVTESQARYNVEMKQEQEELKNYVSDGKVLVANAITEKGIYTAPDEPFINMADNIRNIESKSDPILQIKSDTLSTTKTSTTLTPDSGYDGLSEATVSISTQTKTVSPTTSSQTVNADSGKVLSSVTVNAISTQTKTASLSTSAQTITPDSGKYLTSVSIPAVGGTAAIDDVLANKTFNSGTAGISKTGTMVNRGTWNANVDAGSSVTIPAGYHNGSGKVTGNYYNLNNPVILYSQIYYDSDSHTLSYKFTKSYRSAIAITLSRKSVSVSSNEYKIVELNDHMLSDLVFFNYPKTNDNITVNASSYYSGLVVVGLNF